MRSGGPWCGWRDQEGEACLDRTPGVPVLSVFGSGGATEQPGRGEQQKTASRRPLRPGHATGAAASPRSTGCRCLGSGPLSLARPPVLAGRFVKDTYSALTKRSS